MIESQTFCIVTFLILLLLSGCASPQKSICPHVEFGAPQDMDFSDNEKILLCGDKQKESWKEIPPAQSEFTLRSLLRNRGYFQPKFAYQDGVLSVEPGKLREITSITYQGEPEGFHDIEIRDIVGAPLTTKNLDKIDAFSKKRLKNLGYGCPKVTLEADEASGAVRVAIDKGPWYMFTLPKTPDAHALDLHQNTLRRFDAFALDSRFRQEWLELSSSRVENDGIVISSEYVPQCPSADNRLQIEQKVVGGDKRLITIGIGASTEEFPIGELRYKHVRLDYRGSSAEFKLYGSQRRQLAQATYIDYPLINAYRFSIAPKLSYEHSVERTFNSSEFNVELPFRYQFDGDSLGTTVAFGPSLSRNFSLDDTSGKTATLFSLFARAMLSTHAYELYLTDPRTGWYQNIDFELISEGLAINPFAGRYELAGEYLFQMNPVDPPQWIFGVRYGAGTVDTSERPSSPGILPAKYYLTLGGDQDLRGFARKELNQGTIGAMTRIFAGAEVRYAKSLPLWMEPFAFFDFGWLGSQPWMLDPIAYYDPGGGIRFFTPFGTIRTTLAHGFLSQQSDLFPELEHFQFFLSFGREF